MRTEAVTSKVTDLDQTGAFVYLALGEPAPTVDYSQRVELANQWHTVIFAYRSGITVNSDGSFGPNRATTPGQDYGDPNQNWALAWTPPNTGTG